eukprot:363690-Chlamydomonas_euryale.AAC.5
MSQVMVLNHASPPPLAQPDKTQPSGTQAHTPAACHSPAHVANTHPHLLPASSRPFPPSSTPAPCRQVACPRPAVATVGTEVALHGVRRRPRRINPRRRTSPVVTYTVIRLRTRVHTRRFGRLVGPRRPQRACTAAAAAAPAAAVPTAAASADVEPLQEAAAAAAAARCNCVHMCEHTCSAFLLLQKCMQLLCCTALLNK